MLAWWWLHRADLVTCGTAAQAAVSAQAGHRLSLVLRHAGGCQDGACLMVSQRTPITSVALLLATHATTEEAVPLHGSLIQCLSQCAGTVFWPST
jgi:hypothetical protein